MDNGCSRHMTGDESKFAFLTRRKGGYVTFGDNGKGRIIGNGSIGNNSSSLIENVLLVDGLKHNLLSISQLCDKGFKVIFESSHCIIKDSQNDKIIFMGHRNENVYTIDISKYEGHNRCFSSMHDESWLWHRRLGHVNMNLITQLNKNELVRGLPKISFEKDKVCEACQMGKQIKTSFKNKIFILYQMDVKSAFLNGFINEEVYVEQPLGFGSFNFLNHVFKLKQALYGLKQAPRAWYERLSKFLISSGFKMGKIDTTLFIKLRENDILIVQIYVDDIIFGATNVSLCEEFAKSMHSEFEMSMMGELNFFLSL